MVILNKIKFLASLFILIKVTNKLIKAISHLIHQVNTVINIDNQNFS